MRNEGPFIVEWVCWYRMLGFEILVVTNDCTDHSPALLNALAKAGWLTHDTHKPRDGQPPQKSAHRKIMNVPVTAQADWTLICDVDEFLVLHDHDTIADYMGPPPHDFMAIAFNWKCFGTGDRDSYADGFVHRQFRRCGMGHLAINRSIKSIIRNPQMFERFGAHFPHGFRGDHAAPENAVRTASGQSLPQFRAPENHPIRMVAQDQIDHESAQMNHYILRSHDSYTMKKGTPSAAGFVDRYTDAFFERYNRNGMRDVSALRFKDRFDAVHAQAMALPDVRRLHHLCCAEYVVALNDHAGTDPEDDARYQHHINKATKAI